MFTDMNDGYPDTILQTNQLISPGLSGLRNLGTTCYVNAVIQALSNCPQLTEYFLECSAILDPHHKHVLFTNYCALISEIWRNQRPRCFSTNGIMDAFCIVHPVFRSFSQHDAQEFLRLFLVQLHDELKIPNQLSFDSGDNDLKQTNSATRESRSVITDVFQGQLISTVRCLSCNGLSNKEETFMDLSLSLAKPVAQTLSTASCSSSSKQDIRSRQSPTMNGFVKSNSLHKTYHPYPDTPNQLLMDRSSNKEKLRPSPGAEFRRWPNFDLPIVGRLFNGIPWLITLIFTFLNIALTYLRKYIPSPSKWIDTWSTLTVDECLAHYFSEAELVGENKYFCGICNQCCNGLKQFTLLTLPEILTLHLKRFNSNHVYSSKITSPVHFPLKNLDLRSFLHCDCQDKITTYDLIGVICHYGGCGGGHYITYAFNSSTDSWYEFDDEQVRKLDPEHVESLKSSAYILFYRKQDSNLDPLRQSWQYTPGSPICYISKSWFVKFWTWAEPGPITSEFLCSHGYFRPQLWDLRNDLTLPIPEVIYTKLHQSFGGHSVVRDLVPCAACCDAITKRQKYELSEFIRIDSALQESSVIYAISKRWLDSWFCFVKGRIWEPPGPIDNTNIFVRNPSSSFYFNHHNSNATTTTINNNNNVSFKFTQTSAKSQLDDYDTLSPDLWTMLFNIYGGGPTVPIHCTTTPAECLPVINVNKESALDSEQYLSDHSSSQKSLSNSPNLVDQVPVNQTESVISEQSEPNSAENLNWNETLDSFVPIPQNPQDNMNGDDFINEMDHDGKCTNSFDPHSVNDDYFSDVHMVQSTNLISCQGDMDDDGEEYSLVNNENVLNGVSIAESSHSYQLNGSLNQISDQTVSYNNSLHSAGGDINLSVNNATDLKTMNNRSVKRGSHKRATKQQPIVHKSQ